MLRHRHLRLGVLAIFVYVGAEVAIGSFLINYIAGPDIGGHDRGDGVAVTSPSTGVARWSAASSAPVLLTQIDARRLLASPSAVVAMRCWPSP